MEGSSAFLVQIENAGCKILEWTLPLYLLIQLPSILNPLSRAIIALLSASALFDYKPIVHNACSCPIICTAITPALSPIYLAKVAIKEQPDV